MKQLKGWILEDNLYPFLEILADECQYRFDELDKDALKAGVKEDETFEYSFSGAACSIDLSVFYESGTSVVEIALKVPDALCERIGMLYGVCQGYRLTS
ncbi:MAG TPA: hypothetical protein VE954_17975 [Oligoflexus sp.]|uniref:hypothetical protein n=1 Tax=Oligoflexus sp. TaxID=1971216 RepID=UPI002D323C6D|nr:hypothetical protein [Oligoflexus sp.]HYX34988.1 hypothetical protein [Oligoflexus sp.]